MTLPRHAGCLVDDARAAGHHVTVDQRPGMITVHVEVEISEGVACDTYDAVWVHRTTGWRYLFGTDGWTDTLTLRELRTSVVR